MTLLIKNVFIADRENQERVDVLVRGDKIAAIGNIQMKKADEIIDGQGAFLSSGFIDVHSIADRTLDILRKPTQANYIQQGVTSIIGGQGGLSLAPILYGLDSLREWADLKGINLDWKNTGDLLKTISRIKLGVNFGTLTGYSTLREAFVGDSERSLTKNENQILESMFRKSMAEGSLGISMGLGSLQGKKISMAEARSLMKKVRKETIQTFDFDHIQNSLADLEETLNLAVKTGARLVVNGLEPVKGKESEFKKAVELFSNIGSDADVHFSISPREHKVIPLFKFLPIWAQKGTLADMAKSLDDEWLGEKILKEISVEDADSLVIVGSKRNAALNGLSLRDYAGHHGHRPFKKALFRLMQTTRLDALLAVSSYGDKLINESMKSDKSLISSSESDFYGSPKGSHGRAFINYLSYIKDNGNPMGKQIQKITSLPARLFGLKNRGAIREGAYADLVVFKGGEIKFVAVNGSAAYKDGQTVGSRSGVPLKGNV